MKNCKKILFQSNFLENQESKVFPKKVGFFQFKMSWFKTKVETNLGLQSYMDLSNTAFTLKHKLS